MPDAQEILDILKSSTQEWNSWRNENRDITLRLNNIDLSDLNLRGAQLWNIDFSGSKFRRCDLRDCNFEKSILVNTDFLGSNLEGSNLRECNLKYSKLEFCNLTRSSLLGTDLDGATLKHSNTKNADLTGVIGNYVHDSNENSHSSELNNKSIDALEERISRLEDKIDKKVDFSIFRLAIYFIISLITIGVIGFVYKLLK